MAAFLAGFLGSYAAGKAAKIREEKDREHDAMETRMKMLSGLAQSPNFDPSHLPELIGMMDETSSGKGFQSNKGGKGKPGHLGQIAHLLGPIAGAISPNVQQRQLKPLNIGAPEVESKVTDQQGQQLPNAPGYGLAGMLYTPEERQRLDQQAEDMKFNAQANAQTAAKQREMKNRMDLLHANRDLFSKEDMRDAEQTIITGRAPTRSAAANLPKLGWAQIPDGKGGMKTVSGWVNNVDHTFTDQNGNTVDPSTIQAMGMGKAPGQSQGSQSTQLAQLQNAQRIMANPNASATDKQAAGEYISNFRAGLRNRQMNSVRTGLTIDADRQNLYGTEGAGTGGTISTGTGSTGTGGESKAGGKQLPSGPGPVRNKDGTPNYANPQIASDINFAKDNLLGTYKGGRSQFTQARVARGLGYLHTMLGLSPEQLQGAIQQRKGVGDALVKNTERYAAFTRLDNELTNMGDLLQKARARVPDYATFLNKLANDVRHKYTGDKDTAELVVAVLGYSRVYTTLVSGGWVSNAMPHVTSEADAREAVAAAMTNGQIDGVVTQVSSESHAVRDALVKTSQDLVTQQKAPLGSEVDAIGAGGGGEAKSGKIQVQIPGQKAGWIDKTQLENFKKRYPKAKVF